MKLLLISLLLFYGCTKPDQSNTNNERKKDPIDGASGQIVYATPEDWNVIADTLTDCGSVFLNWDAQPWADRYYVLFEKDSTNGSGSCPYIVTIDNVDYFYPHKFSPINYTALHIGTICGTLPQTDYNIIILYYEFYRGKWYGLSSLPIPIRFNRAYYQCPL